ncbi:9147_t:CDS:2 [Dentiscutata erythropus]|uniref:9147_t:CDS:1 n=1 Tax=Dentiscutata erythropus TaxID=1348616 RepID=A0A9N9CEH3_9GLOM|nr:9147_t:CDS:2 [Dentiscutata erythropus]
MRTEAEWRNDTASQAGSNRFSSTSHVSMGQYSEYTEEYETYWDNSGWDFSHNILENIMQSNALSTHAKGNPTECFQTSDTGSNGRMPVGIYNANLDTSIQGNALNTHAQGNSTDYRCKRFIDEIELKNEKKGISHIDKSKSYIRKYIKGTGAIEDLRNAINTSTIEYDSERKHEDLRGEIMDEVKNDQIVSEAVQELSDLGKRENASDTEEERVLKRQYNRDGYITPLPRRLDNLIIESPKFSESNQHSIFYGGLPSYEEGIEIDPELVLKETNEVIIPYFERSFNYDFWNCWTLKSGSVVTELLEKASNVKGHPLRPEVWRIIRYGFKIAKPKWLSNEEYTEIQSFAKCSSITSPPKDIIELLKIKLLKSLELEVKKFKKDKLNAHLLENITSQNFGEDLNLETIKITCSILYPEDTFTAFFVKILSLFHKFVFIEGSVMQQPDVLEADYGDYLIYPCLKKNTCRLRK